MKKKSTIVRVSLFLAVIIVVLSVPALASTSEYIDGTTGLRTLEDTFSLGQSGDYSAIYVQPGDEIRIPLTADMFTWSNDRQPLKREALGKREFRGGGVTVRTVRQRGAVSLDYVQVDEDTFKGKPFFIPKTNIPTSKTAYISVMFAEELVDVNEVDFEFEIYVAVDGRIQDDLRITLTGVLANEEFPVYEELDFLNIADATVAVAEDNTDRIEFDIGSGVSIYQKMTKGRKYYGTAEVKPATDPGFEENYPEVYPTVVAAYKLNTVNMRYGGSRVTIDNGDDVHHVYAADMSYLGTTDDTLIYSDYYFLTKELIPSFGDAYLEDLSTNPMSMRVEASANDYLDIDEGKILREKQKKADSTKNFQIDVYSELNSRTHSVAVGKGERVDVSPHVSAVREDGSSTETRRQSVGVVSGVEKADEDTDDVVRIIGSPKEDSEKDEAIRVISGPKADSTKDETVRVIGSPKEDSSDISVKIVTENKTENKTEVAENTTTTSSKKTFSTGVNITRS